MRLALRAKKKLGFIDGLVSKPEDDDAKEKNGGRLAPPKKTQIYRQKTKLSLFDIKYYWSTDRKANFMNFNSSRPKNEGKLDTK